MVEKTVIEELAKVEMHGCRLVSIKDLSTKFFIPQEEIIRLWLKMAVREIKESDVNIMLNMEEILISVYSCQSIVNEYFLK